MDQAAEIIEVPQSPTVIETSNNPPVKVKSRAKIYFSFQDSVQLTEIPFILMLFLAVIIFGVAVFPLGMLTYDYQGLILAESGSFFSYLQQVTTANGLLHPLGLVFNSAMYLLATQSYGMAHLFVFAAHAFTAILLAVMISRKYTRIESALFGIIFLSLPLFTGQYGWLAQGNITIAIFVLGLQLLIVQSTRLDLVVKSSFLVVLQILAILLHESMLFSFIPILLFLLPTERPYFRKVHLRTMLLLCIPSALYLVFKIFIIQPRSLHVFFQNEILNGFVNFFGTVSSFFLHPEEYLGFWSTAFFDGVTMITHMDIMLLFMVSLIGLLIYELAVFFTHRFTDGHVFSPLVNPLFWAILGLCTSIPYNPSAMGFPLFCFLIAILQFIRLFSRRVALIGSCILVVLFLPLSLGLLEQMKTQAAIDNMHIKQIVEHVDATTSNTEKVIVVIENPPTAKTLLLFNQYMKPCIDLEDCINPALMTRSQRISRVYVYGNVGIVPEGISGRVIPFIYNPQENIIVPK